MRRWTTVADSLDLLSQRDRRRLGAVTLIQMMTGLLDAAGVAIFGIVAAMATSAVSNTPLPSSVQSVASRFGVEASDMLVAAVWLCVAAGLLLILKSVVNVLLTRRVLKFLANRQAIVSGRLAASLLERPLVQVQKRQSQETAFALTTGVNAALIGVLGQGITIATEVSLLAILALGLLALDPLVAIFAVAFFAGIGWILQRIMSKRARRLGETNSKAEVASMALVQESISTYREVLVAHRRDLYVDQFRGLRWQAAEVQAELNLMALVPKYVFEIALIIGAGLLAWTQFLLKDASAAMATIAIFLAAGSRVVPSMLRLQGAALGMRVTSGMARPCIKLARELSDGESLTDRGSDGHRMEARDIAAHIADGHPDFLSSIDVEDLTFSYSEEGPLVLEGVSLRAAAGMSVALVGPTGAGKSTLADAILGVVQPRDGQVRVGGLRPLDAIARWPGGIAYVPQEVAMNAGSIRQNVALGLPEALIDDDRVWEALERAKLASYLRAGRQGLDTVIGEAGVRLSGGQRQRLGIARALYTRPLLLVLDEATSALDAETEHAIVDTLQDLEGEVTTVTVAHRLATIRHCDLVAYLEQGHVMATGSFDEVVAAVPNFARQARLLGLAR
jgi:ABC-type multidrug transport system fused ATPase/permease subunit